MKKQTLLFLILAALLCCVTAASADYLFEVPSQEVILWFEPDGHASISYEYELINRGQALDFIDIGTPNNNFYLSDVTAELNGRPINVDQISYADYQVTKLNSGVTVDISNQAIGKDESAKFYVCISNIEKMLFEYSDATQVAEGSESELYASFQFMPNYFGSTFVRGTTDYTFRVVYPSTVGEADAMYQNPMNWPGESQPESWYTQSGDIVYQWHFADAKASGRYTFGGMFRKSCLTSFDQIAAGSVDADKSADGFGIDWEEIISCLLCFGVPLAFFILIVIGIKKSNHASKSRSYLPPIVNSDGEGIKRGLTAVEAAVLLEEDLDRVLTMILFGLSKKGILQIRSVNPFQADIADNLPTGLNPYEIDMIRALKEKDSKQREKQVVKGMRELVMSVSEKMNGFNAKETREYYRGIIQKAWNQVEKAGTPELKSELLEKHFGWAMLEEKTEEKFETVFGNGDFTAPTWWWRMDPAYPRPVSYSVPSTPSAHSHHETSASPKSSGGSVSTPVLPGAKFARSVTNSCRSLSSAVAGFALGALTSRVSAATNPAPVSSSDRHSSSGSGGGCACACACNCAGCACACAGGGR